MGTITILPETPKDPLALIGRRAGICWNADIINEEKNIKRGIDCIKSGHGRTLEFVDVHMIIDGFSARVMREYYRHVGGMTPYLQACTEPEGRMVTKAILDVSIKGIGKLHKTSIFPCGIFQCMKGVNRKPGDPNYDLFQLALKSTAKRLYPNYANVDWSGNDGYDVNDPKTYFSTINKTVA